MSETLEQRMRRLAREDDATLCQVYPGDVVELLDERDKIADKLIVALNEVKIILADTPFESWHKVGLWMEKYGVKK